MNLFNRCGGKNISNGKVKKGEFRHMFHLPEDPEQLRQFCQGLMDRYNDLEHAYGELEQTNAELLQQQGLLGNEIYTLRQSRDDFVRRLLELVEENSSFKRILDILDNGLPPKSLVNLTDNTAFLGGFYEGYDT